ncbi:BioY family transporter [Suicoccus acidiformans]|uniref:Biotin transporter n=1 Tax=Suicoccus acidiformans TaxID=2036206 RepID=A0A347WNH0_9LACT|nr:biotin transporter BioY [Suicoccus acidiformans]AXY26627.1 BioY family transporter [Suicoccus acidiformans]
MTQTRNLTLTGLMLAMLIICSQISIPLGPVPITLQTFAVLLIAYLLKPKQAFICTSLYLILGIAGLPIFANAGGGLQSITLPTFGFLLAFIPASVLTAKYIELFGRTSRSYMISALLFHSLVYLLGLLYFTWIMNGYLGKQMHLWQILSVAFLPFIPGDCLKAGMAIYLSRRLHQAGLVE